MVNKLFLCLILTAMLSARTAAAQDYNIKGDTIRVSSKAFPLLSFMGEIRNSQLLCPDYRLVTSTTTITIRPNASKPVPVCMLIVDEGAKNSPRQHQFVLIFDKDADPSEQIHDYSTKDLIEQRIAFIEKSRKSAEDGSKGPAAIAAAPEPKESKRTRKKEDRQAVKEERQVSIEAPPTAPVKPPVKALVQEKPETPQVTVEGASTADATEIKDVPIDLIEARVKQKINLFYKSCSLLCSKTDIDETIRYAMKLFNNEEEVLVETTNSRTNAKSSKKIRQYLTHLSQLNYKKVVMTASEIKFVSKFHLGPDKKWHASAVVIQDFEGYRDNIVAYKDVTNKTIDIIINTFEEERDGKTITKFEIYLGNISVTNIPS